MSYDFESEPTSDSESEKVEAIKARLASSSSSSLISSSHELDFKVVLLEAFLTVFIFLKIRTFSNGMIRLLIVVTGSLLPELDPLKPSLLPENLFFFLPNVKIF